MDIILSGFMGTGKTTVGKLLGNRLNLKSWDLDREISKYTKMSINEIFSKNGEQYFRIVEHKVLQETIFKPGILSIGGGTPVLQSNIKVIKDSSAKVILLDAELGTIWSRINNDSGRPLVSTIDKLDILKKERQKYYRQISKCVIQTDGLSPLDVAKEIEGIYI